MFIKNEVKEFTIKYGKKWFFPNFSNKLTWYVITIGAGIIITPTPFKLVFYNWLVDTFNINSGSQFTLSEVNSNSADYMLGFGLVIAALLHNLFGKWLLLQESFSKKSITEKRHEVDKALFNEFLKIFPSGCPSAYLLESHDFGNSFSLKSLEQLDTFVYEWNCPEKQFIDPGLEKHRKELWKKCNEFAWLIAKKTAPVFGGYQSAVPDRVKSDWDWPEWVENDIKELNTLSSETFKAHQSFIKLMRELLTC